MNERTQPLFLGLLAGFLATISVLLVCVLIVVYSGAYNVSATSGHTALVRWALTTSLESSVTGRASDLSAPEQATQSELAEGAAEYKAMCQHCHGGPGVEAEKWAHGMLPKPPHLTEAAAQWQTKEIFWIAKHGLKMTGMPAFGLDHSDSTIWNIANFVSRLPGMTAEEYAKFGGRAIHGHTH